MCGSRKPSAKHSWQARNVCLGLSPSEKMNEPRGAPQSYSQVIDIVENMSHAISRRGISNGEKENSGGFQTSAQSRQLLSYLFCLVILSLIIIPYLISLPHLAILKRAF